MTKVGTVPGAHYHRLLLAATITLLPIGLSCGSKAGEPKSSQPASDSPEVATIQAAFNERGAAAAIEEANRILAANPQDAGVLQVRGQLQLEAKNPQQACADFDRSLAILPEDAKVLVARGRAAECLGRYDDALGDYKRALQTQPKSIGALARRGALLDALGRRDEAQRDLAQALSLPASPSERQAVVDGMLASALWAVDRAGAALQRRGQKLPDLEWQHARTLTYHAFAQARIAYESPAERLKAVLPHAARLMAAIFQAARPNANAFHDTAPLEAFDVAGHRRLAAEIARRHIETEWHGRFLNLALHVAVWAYSGARLQDLTRLGRVVEAIGGGFQDPGIARLGRTVASKEYTQAPAPDVTLELRRALVLAPWLQARNELHSEQAKLTAIENWAPVPGEEIDSEQWVERDAEHSRAMLRRELAEVKVQLVEIRAQMLLPEDTEVLKILQDREAKAK